MSLNVVVLTGRLVADPELRMTTKGNEVATFRIAVDRPKSKDSNAQTADFFTVVAWGSTALFVSRYFSKGSPIALQGNLQSRTYEDGNGGKKTVIEVVAREVSFTGSKNETSTPSATPYDTSTHAHDPYTNRSPGNPSSVQGFSSASASDFEEIGDDEDTPF